MWQIKSAQLVIGALYSCTYLLTYKRCGSKDYSVSTGSQFCLRQFVQYLRLSSHLTHWNHVTFCCYTAKFTATDVNTMLRPSLHCVTWHTDEPAWDHGTAGHCSCREIHSRRTSLDQRSAPDRTPDRQTDIHTDGQTVRMDVSMIAISKPWLVTITSMPTFSRRRTTSVTVVWLWPWPRDLGTRPWPRYSEDVPVYQTKGIQKLQPELDRQTDRHTVTLTLSWYIDTLTQINWRGLVYQEWSIWVKTFRSCSRP